MPVPFSPCNAIITLVALFSINPPSPFFSRQASPDLQYLQTLFLGASAVFVDEQTVAVSIVVHDAVYIVDFSVKHVSLGGSGDPIADFVVSAAYKYEQDNLVKFIGAGLPPALRLISPTLCSRLWLELDIVPLVLRPDGEGKESTFWDVRSVDEQADSMARKCIMQVHPGHRAARSR